MTVLLVAEHDNTHLKPATLHAMTAALKLGEVSALTPISFVQLVIVTIAGWLWFGETLDRWTLAGAAIIFSATFYIARREAMLARQHRSSAPCEGVEPGH